MTKAGRTEIVVVLDRSGSMMDVRADMVGGFGEFIETQKKVPGECLVSLFQFDDRHEEVYLSLPLSAVPSLDLQPRGWTALFDAVGKSIASFGARLAKLDESERPEKVLFMIITDGHENASKEYSQEVVAGMVKHQQEKYNWEFVFLGADAGVFEQAQKLNIRNAAQYTASAGGCRGMSAAISDSAAAYRSGGAYSISSNISPLVGSKPGN